MRRFWKSAFQTVIEQYQEIRAANEGAGALNYEKLSNAGGFATCTYNPRVVKPTLSDFVCDVEIAARTTLDKAELKTFRDADDPQSVPEEIQMKLGKIFAAREIYPISNYFQTVDLR
jgi:hypothetical protein